MILDTKFIDVTLKNTTFMNNQVDVSYLPTIITDT